MRKQSSRLAAPAVAVLATLVAVPALDAGRPAPASATAAAKSTSADQTPESVLVTGEGEVFGKPDTLDATFAVETTASTVAEALKRANTAAARMRDTLVRRGVAKADLQTSNVSLTSTRKDDGTVIGYTANQGLTARIRNLPQGGALMSAAVAAGGDAARVLGASFSIEDDAALLAEARKKAFADARQRAALYAREAGRPLGRVLKVSEASPAQWKGGDRFAASDSSVPLEPGRQALTVTITVEWALDAPAPRSRRS
ncbi:SIMPL domain-containing protein [Actinoplanes sp. M2I2]|uniref:SIMPL domain-containing protein n=1 Tax=Actinoplanes sp. M2I2 TaxID=1734444 RepID=UPI0020207DBD|nr:SIMPL domain-containing protein [Actinoplanes sp. M2I2]